MLTTSLYLQNNSEQHVGQNDRRNAREFDGYLLRRGDMIGTVTRAKAFFAHNGDVATITRATRLRLEHVKIMPFVVALMETFGAERHAGTNAARATTVRHWKRKGETESYVFISHKSLFF